MISWLFCSVWVLSASGLLRLIVEDGKHSYLTLQSILYLLSLDVGGHSPLLANDFYVLVPLDRRPIRAILHRAADKYLAFMPDALTFKSRWRWDLLLLALIGSFRRAIFLHFGGAYKVFQVNFDRVMVVQSWDARVEGRARCAKVFLLDLQVRQRSEVSQIWKRALIRHRLLPVAYHLLVFIAIS